jgi:hypothetical protein
MCFAKIGLKTLSDETVLSEGGREGGQRNYETIEIIFGKLVSSL